MKQGGNAVKDSKESVCIYLATNLSN